MNSLINELDFQLIRFLLSDAVKHQYIRGHMDSD